MTPDQLVFFVKQYGFPIVSSVGMGYFVYFIYRFVTLKLMPVIGETNGILVSLIDGRPWPGVFYSCAQRMARAITSVSISTSSAISSSL